MAERSSDESDFTDVELNSLRSRKKLKSSREVPLHGHRVVRRVNGELQFVHCQNPDCHVLRVHLAEVRNRNRRLRRRRARSAAIDIAE